MRIFIAIIMLVLTCNLAVAKLKGKAYRTEKSALAMAIATENTCGHQLNALSLRGYIFKVFEGNEAEFLASINNDVEYNKLVLKSATNSQTRTLCAAAALFISKNKL